MTRAVAITGVGAVTPLGVGADALHEGWVAGRCAIREGLSVCEDFDPAHWLSRKEIRTSDRFAQLAVAAADEAMRHSGLADDLWHESDRVACVVATGIGGISTLEAQRDVQRTRGADFIAPMGIVMTMANSAAMSLSLRFGLRGESGSIISACASATQALGAGMRMIRSGEADAVLVGGAEAAISPFCRGAFGVIGATSKVGISRPFDRRRDGFVLGEGAGVLVLERPDAAAARGARVLGELAGYGASSDAFHATAPPDRCAGGALAMRRALRDAASSPQDVAYVNAHGTSTPFNDRAETLALKDVLGDHAWSVPVSSTKSAVGHALGASGAIEAVATLLALRDGVAPPTLGLEEPDDDLDLNYVPGRAQPFSRDPSQPPLALSNSFGFGGHNAVVALRAGAAAPGPGT